MQTAGARTTWLRQRFGLDYYHFEELETEPETEPAKGITR